MIRTDAEIEALANSGTPSQIADAMTAYEDHIRFCEARIRFIEQDKAHIHRLATSISEITKPPKKENEKCRATKWCRRVR